jgi:enoyl-[acyl-carrier protein] reductase / trans-2-enoyl-CoA reductase (NAD+)
MIIRPRMREFICTTAHPIGCAELVRRQVERARRIDLANVPRRVLVIGCSGGYGLATRTVTGFGGGAATIGVSFERSPEPDRTASAGWYNNRAFEALAKEDGLDALTIEADAFADATKEAVCAAIAERWGQVDLLIYSLAAPSRRDSRTGTVHYAAVKPTVPISGVKSLDTDRGRVITVDIAAASETEIAGTIKVMGGEDWQFWTELLIERGLAAPGFRSYHYTYLGTDATRPIYRDGTIGRAKADVERASAELTERHGKDVARVVVLPTAVTQASSAIPIVPLYASILRRVQADLGGREDALDQISRLYGTSDTDLPLDAKGRIRMDGGELDPAIQAEIAARWPHIADDTLDTLADFPGYRADQLGLFGFAVSGVDYEESVDPQVVRFLTPHPPITA